VGRLVWLIFVIFTFYSFDLFTFLFSDNFLIHSLGLPPYVAEGSPPRPRPRPKGAPPLGAPRPPLYMPRDIPLISVIIIAIGLPLPPPPKPPPPRPMPGLFLRLGMTVSCLPLKSDSLRCLALIALSRSTNSMYANLNSYLARYYPRLC